MKRAFVAVRAVVYASLFVSLWVWIAIRLRSLDPYLVLRLPSWVRPIGGVLALCGLAIGVGCIYAFIAYGHGTPAPFDPPREFVAVGPYRLVRNPMYVGGFVLILGAGLFVLSPAIVALAFVLLAVTHVMVVLVEEPDLQRRFGESYQRYRASVRRWLPAPPRSTSGSALD
ncbi:MAG: isoprenylcysteine carboxylmethyltransferase family protein [Thermoanaerobaculia bacterium]